MISIMGKRDIIQLLGYPSESEPEVEVDAPRPKRQRIPKDRLMDHPAEPTIHRQRSQGFRLGNVQPATNLTSDSLSGDVNGSSIWNTARETDLQVHPQDFAQSHQDNINNSVFRRILLTFLLF